jgi:hypothetical protein
MAISSAQSAAGMLCDAGNMASLGDSEVSRFWSLIPEDEVTKGSAYMDAVELLLHQRGRQGRQGVGRVDAGEDADGVVGIAGEILGFAEFLVRSSSKDYPVALAMVDKAVALLDERGEGGAKNDNKKAREMMCSCLTLGQSTPPISSHHELPLLLPHRPCPPNLTCPPRKSFASSLGSSTTPSTWIPPQASPIVKTSSRTSRRV